ncbi:MAG: YfhO family protein, partial [Elusimicrobiota bacterium]
AVRTLEREAGIFRVLGLGGALPANTGMMYGLQDIRGQDFMSVRRYEELITGWAGDFHFYSAARVPPAALAALNVRYAVVRSDVPPPVWDWKRVHRGKADIYRVTPYHERALVVYRHEVLTREAVLARMTAPGFDPAQTLLLEEEPPAAPPRAGAPSRTESVRIAGYGPDAVAVEAALPRPGFLLLLDTYYPGWRAEVNGTPAPLLRADYNFRAVPLPAGRSTVVFSYEPASFRIGVLLACLAAALLMLIGCRVKKA